MDSSYKQRIKVYKEYLAFPLCLDRSYVALPLPLEETLKMIIVMIMIIIMIDDDESGNETTGLLIVILTGCIASFEEF